MFVTIEQLKAEFPNPVPALHSAEGEYCVGGALCRYLAKHGETCPISLYWPRFPSSTHLLCALVMSNNKLDISTARRYADHIIWLNDVGRFEASWLELGSALEHGLIKDDMRM